MAQTAIEDSLTEESTPTVAFIIARNGDPLTIALRKREQLDTDELLQLSQASSSASTCADSSRSEVFSSREPSVVTKPTSFGTNYPAHNSKGKGNVDTTYAASLSATNGSGSETETEHDDAHHTALLGTGAWTLTRDDDRCLRRAGNAKIRLSRKLPNRQEKPLVKVHQASGRGTAAPEHDKALHIVAAPVQAGVGSSQQSYTLAALITLVVLLGFLSETLVGQGRCRPGTLPQ